MNPFLSARRDPIYQRYLLFSITLLVLSGITLALITWIFGGNLSSV